jgi:hypothetical protein
MSTQIYSTSQNTLTTALRMNGHEPVGARVRRGKVFWDFKLSDELLEEIARYTEGRCCVDPSRFIHALNETRDEMFDLLDAHKTTN